MKVRSGFVSNSSSSSFVLDKNYLEDEQIELIVNHRAHALEILNKLKTDELFRIATGVEHFEDYEFDPTWAWNVEETSSKIKLETYLDNFNMEKYLQIIRANDATCEDN